MLGELLDQAQKAKMSEDLGFGIVPSVFTPAEVAQLASELEDVARSRAGARHLMAHPAVVRVANDARLLALARRWLGPEARPYRATLFDKSPDANWLVVWHQDTALPLRHRSEVSGWGPWSVKAGVLYILKQGFKDHCNRIGASSSRILDELNQPRARGSEVPSRVVIERAVRRTLGGGTSLAKGQSWCFSVDMRHAEISGAVPLAAIQGGQPTSAPAGNLKAVK